MHAYQPDRLEQASKKQNVFIDTLFTHPALSAGAALSMVLTAAVLTNAIWYQPGKHPSPLFSTRTVASSPQAEVAAKAPESNKPKIVTTASLEASPELLKEVQTALSVRGYYAGKLDGVYGSRTKSAIDQFQRDRDLKVDGKASVRLLTQILMSGSARPSEVPVPKTQTIASKTKEIKTAKADKAAEKPTANGLVAQIQSGLKAYGYDDLIVDGKMGQHTATAIQRFQLDYGMKITGEPSDQVLKKLREIGAYTQG